MKQKTTLITYCVLFLLAGSSLKAQTLVAHYKFNGNTNSSGGTYTDALTAMPDPTAAFSYGKDNTGASNAALIATYHSGDTSNREQHLIGANNLTLSGGTSRTYTCWVKIPGGIADNGSHTIGIVDTGEKVNGGVFSIAMFKDTHSKKARLLNVGVQGYGAESVTAVGVDEWTFIATTFLNNADGSPNANGTVSVYMTTGTDIATSDFSDTPSITINTAASPLYVGTSLNNVEKRGLVGSIADLQIYEGALSIAQLNTVKNGASLGIGDIAFTKEELNVFPNAVTHFLNIKTSIAGKLEVAVYDLQGKVLIKQYSDKVDMRDLASGLYIVKVRAGEKVAEVKVIKK